MNANDLFLLFPVHCDIPIKSMFVFIFLALPSFQVNYSNFAVFLFSDCYFGVEVGFVFYEADGKGEETNFEDLHQIEVLDVVEFELLVAMRAREHPDLVVAERGGGDLALVRFESLDKLDALGHFAPDFEHPVLAARVEQVEPTGHDYGGHLVFVHEALLVLQGLGQFGQGRQGLKVSRG